MACCNFKENILTLYGHEGQVWLKKLPLLIDELSEEWSLAQLEPVTNLTYHYLLKGYQNRVPIVLKLGFDSASLRKEAQALEHLQDYGGVRLFDKGLTKGALLLEQVVPGISLKFLFPEYEEETARVLSQVIQRLHQAQRLSDKEQFPKVEDGLKKLEENFPLPSFHLEKARSLAQHLLKTSGCPVFLHGDLHHDNILLHGVGEWKVIDPKGVIGEPAYEVGAFIRNPIPDIFEHSEAEEILRKRIFLIARYLALEPQRIKDWAYVQAVLCAIWAFEDGFEQNPWLKAMDLLHQS